MVNVHATVIKKNKLSPKFKKFKKQDIKIQIIIYIFNKKFKIANKFKKSLKKTKFKIANKFKKSLKKTKFKTANKFINLRSY